jgi:hypothetical protein
MADLAGVLKELEEERGRLDHAIQVIGNLVARHRAGMETRPKGLTRTLSAAARRKISLAQTFNGVREQIGGRRLEAQDFYALTCLHLK